jgi:hypothetical protein
MLDIAALLLPPITAAVAFVATKTNQMESPSPLYQVIIPKKLWVCRGSHISYPKYRNLNGNKREEEKERDKSNAFFFLIFFSKKQIHRFPNSKFHFFS